MKKKVISILLTLGITMSLLSGCGDTSSTTAESSTENVETAASGQEASQEEGTSDEIDMGDIVFYKELPEPKYLFSDVTFEPIDEVFDLTSINNFPVYNADGVNVGYIKNEKSVTVTEQGVNSSWLRFENPIDGTDYDYLYVMMIDIPELGTASNNYTFEEYLTMFDEALEEYYNIYSEQYDAYVAEHPNASEEVLLYDGIVNPTPTQRLDSADGLEFLHLQGISMIKSECDDENDGIKALAEYYFQVYDSIYFEVVDERYGYVDVNFYANRRENVINFIQ